jgi:undecaprenyl-diphosphatase
MNIFDTVAIHFVNQFSQHSLIFNKMLHVLSYNNLFKGSIFAVIIWWAWFDNNEDHSRNRKHIILTIISSLVAIALARGLALALPFRHRPLSQEGLHFLLPHGVKMSTLEYWSSFPSDHATLFFALSVGFLFISRKVGIFSLFYTAFLICFPRIYLGLHYPTDIIAGAVIGITIAIMTNHYLLRSKWLQSIENWSYSTPGLFYPLFFLLTYQIANLFDESRAIVAACWKLCKIIFA